VRDRGFITRSQAGDQARFDVAAMARELTLAIQAHAAPGGEAPRVLFDWSGLTSWAYTASSQKDIAFWKATVPQIARAAVVHIRRWDNQAALLAALLRLANAEVRSFSPVQRDDAITWLTYDFVAKDDEAITPKEFGEQGSNAWCSPVIVRGALKSI
jgi:SpoIIAA-like